MGKVEIDITDYELQDIKKFCELNNVDFDKVLKKSLKTGYNIEKYGLLGKMGGEQEKWVEKEVIREKRVEIPVEVIKEVIVEKIVEVVKEVPVDKIVEVVKEIPVEKIVKIYDKTDNSELLLKIQELENEKKEFSTKIDDLTNEVRKFSTKNQEMEKIFQNTPKLDDDRTQQLQQTVQTLMGKIREKDNEIKQLKEQIDQLNKSQEKSAVYLRSSNLGDNLYK
jgi:predicted RNase H-like nuclease (RuvC/YqgF family)